MRLSYFSLFFVFLFVGLTAARSQIKLALSEKHISKINNSKSASKKLQLYRKYYKKDSIKSLKKAERYWQAKTDSLTRNMRQREKALDNKTKKLKDGINSKVYSTVYKPWAKRQANLHLQWLITHQIKMSPVLRMFLQNYLEDYFLQASQNDSLLLAMKQTMPNVQLPKQLNRKLDDYKILNPDKVKNYEQLAKGKLSAIKNADKLGEFKNQANAYSGKLSEYGKLGQSLSNGDSVKGFIGSQGEKFATAQASRLGEFSELGRAQGELTKLKGMPGDYGGEVENLQDSTYRKEQAKKKAEELAMKYITENPALMNGMQKKMGLLMKKYSIVPNSNDLSTATKRNTLKGKSLKERLYYAGNFQLLTLDPVCIDFSPMVGYRITRILIAGIGGNYRQSFKDTIPTLSPNVLGYRVFSSYDLVKNFFAYGEFDRNSSGVVKTETSSKRIWKNAAFLGIGRKVQLHRKIEMTVTMMYNFLHEPKDPIYPRAWTMRIGLQTSELAMHKTKPTF